MVKKMKWAAARILFMLAAVASAASGNVFGYLLGPLYSWYFFNDLHFWKYRRYFSPVTVCAGNLLAEWIRNPAYRSMFAIPLSSPPMAGPDRSRVRVRASWAETDHACNGCIQCCSRRCCPLLDADLNRCRSYGSFFWRYFNCGRYPENAEQIRYYACRNGKWPMTGAHTRPIPQLLLAGRIGKACGEASILTRNNPVSLAYPAASRGVGGPALAGGFTYHQFA